MTIRRRSALAALASLSLLGGGAVPGSTATDDSEPFVLRVPVLAVHRVTCPEADVAIPELWICPAQLRAQLEALRGAGWATLTAAELARRFVDREMLPPRTFVITIDDGVDDGYHEAAPILADLGMRATFYVIAGKTAACDVASRRMTWCEVRELRDAGHDIGNHTLNHVRLASLTDEQVRAEVEDAAVAFETELGQRPTTFAYPYGEVDARYIDAVEASGHVLAFTFHGPGGPPGERPDQAYVGEDRPFESERITLYPTDEPDELVARLEPFASDS